MWKGLLNSSPLEARIFFLPEIQYWKQMSIPTPPKLCVRGSLHTVTILATYLRWDMVRTYSETVARS
eukprot:6214400-Pleurochrysis_carterae.AAC.2